MNAIELTNVNLFYGKFQALKNINLKVKKGQFYGLLGPNGAGKSSLISMLCTLRIPTTGTATVNDYDVTINSNEVRKSIGIVFQEQAVDDELTGEQNLELHAQLYGVKNVKQKVKEALELVELITAKDKLVREYSGGMKRRLEIARGLMHEPHILFLDEPTLGLDVQTRNNIWKYLKKLHGKTTILLTTHYMEEADELCDEIAIIDQGKIIDRGTSKQLKEKHGKTFYLIKTDDDQKALKLLKKFDVKIVEDQIKISKANEKSLVKIIGKLKEAKITLLQLEVKTPTLENVFIKLTGKHLREENATNADKMRNMRGFRR